MGTHAHVHTATGTRVWGSVQAQVYAQVQVAQAQARLVRSSVGRRRPARTPPDKAQTTKHNAQVRSMGSGGAVTPPKAIAVLPGDRSSSGGMVGKMVRSLSFSKRNKKPNATNDGWSPDAVQGSARGSARGK